MKSVLVEKTGKKLKAHTLLSVGLLLVGIIATLTGSSMDYPAVAVGGVVLIVAGLVWLAVTKARTWWHHG